MGKIVIITLDEAEEHVLNKILDSIEAEKIQFVDISPAPVLSLSNLSLYPHECKVEVNGQELTLGPRQFALLYLLARNVGRIFTKEQIYYQVWNESTAINVDDTIRYHVSEIRKKLEQIYQEIDKLEKSKVEVKHFSRKNEQFFYFALIGALLLILEALGRYTLLRKIP